MIRFPFVVSVTLPLLLTACEAGTVIEVPREGTTGVERHGFTVIAPVPPELEAMAADSGWTDGVPGIEIRIHRMGDPLDQWVVDSTGTDGSVRFDDLLGGYFRVAATRTFELSETTGGEPAVFSDGWHARLRTGNDTLVLELNRNKKGLVIQEIYNPSSDRQDTYDVFHYHRINNASDSVIYLDGMLYGAAFHITADYPNAFSCENTEFLRLDPEGLWTMRLHQFPGTGADYPIHPGESKLLALDAIDHRPYSEHGIDLRNADFEFEAGADNPAVPNMPDVGLQADPYSGGKGVASPPGTPYFLAMPVDLDAAPRDVLCGRSCAQDFLRIPADAVLDVVVVWKNAPSLDLRDSPCERPVLRGFDRLPGGFLKAGAEVDWEFSAQRRVVPGAKDLQDTDVTLLDFEKARRTIER